MTKTPLYTWWHDSHFDSLHLKQEERKKVTKMRADALRHKLDKMLKAMQLKAKEEEEKAKAKNPTSLAGRTVVASSGDIEMGRHLSVPNSNRTRSVS
jgi:hypothetical protein